MVRHELGHAMGMMEYGSDEQYPSWDCGTKGNVMYGDNIGAWSRCNAMDFRRMYTKFHDNWCMPGIYSILFRVTLVYIKLINSPCEMIVLEEHTPANTISVYGSA